MQATSHLVELGYETPEMLQRADNSNVKGESVLPRPEAENSGGQGPSGARQGKAGAVSLLMFNCDTEVYKRLARHSHAGYKQSWTRHLWLCIQRQFLLEFTNKGLIISRLVLNLVNGLMTVTVYQFHGNEQYVLRLRTALIFHILMSKVISVVSHIGLFAQDRPIFYKQHAGYFFRSSNFWLAHNFFQLVFWGFLESGLLAAPIYWLSGFHKDFGKFMLFWMALYFLNLNSSVIFKVLAVICPTISMAQTMAGLVQVSFFLFSGYLQPWSVLPPGWLWVKWGSPQSYAFSIMLINEFSGYDYTCNAEELQKSNGICPYTTGDQYLGDIYALKGDTNDIGLHFIGLAGWYVIYLVIGAVCLHLIKFSPSQLQRAKPYVPSTDKRSLLLPKPAVLVWHGVSYTVKQKKKEKVLLDRVSGIIRPSMMTALMGPSGAGKTTLLDVIAGRKTGGKITGDITINGHPKEQKVLLHCVAVLSRFRTVRLHFCRGLLALGYCTVAVCCSPLTLCYRPVALCTLPFLYSPVALCYSARTLC